VSFSENYFQVIADDLRLLI
jgi:hypothetical protein